MNRVVRWIEALIEVAEATKRLLIETRRCLWALVGVIAAASAVLTTLGLMR